MEAFDVCGSSRGPSGIAFYHSKGGAALEPACAVVVSHCVRQRPISTASRGQQEQLLSWKLNSVV